MARIGGRNLWLAWPAGLLCAGVVGALVWLAVPAIPGTVLFVGDTLRAATSAPEAAAARPVGQTALDGSAPSGIYTVVRLLPNDSTDREYRIKNIRDGHERVVRESQIRRGPASPLG